MPLLRPTALAFRTALILSAASLLDVATSASAATLALTSSTLSLEVEGLGNFQTQQVVDPMPVFVSSGSGDFVLSPSVFQETGMLPSELFTGQTLISAVDFTVTNQTMSFGDAGGPGGAFGGPGQLSGAVRPRIFGGLVNLAIPLNVIGAGGVSQQSAAALMITVTGHAGWGTGNAVVTRPPTPSNPFEFPLSASGYDNRTANHRGTVLLVTPFRAITNAAGTLRAFAFQRLTFVPEASTLLLFSFGFAALVRMQRQKRNR